MTARDVRIERYREFLERHALRFGFGDEIVAFALRQKGTAVNDIPPVELWHQIVPTARLLEQVREKFGVTTVMSAYRAPAYNTAVGGETKSQHMENRAIDFTCATGTPAEWAAFLTQLRSSGAFAGGIGCYPKQNFVHVDTRGFNATWAE